jgi:glycerophosphoryl diester phosphodiesterase
MIRNVTAALLIAGATGAGRAETADAPLSIQLGPRPFFLVDDMDEGALKEKLKGCQGGPFARSAWSIGHRGAALQFPEHTRESYMAAARMGAGIVECDVTFTKDRELVCRHAQNDLAVTTDILATELASTCAKPFTPAGGNRKASAECMTSDITLAEFKSLNGKMDAADTTAASVEEYLNGTPNWRTDLYATRGTLVSHAESIELLKSLSVKFAPELKAPSVGMPFDGDYTHEVYAQQMIDEYKAAGIAASDVFAQSFHLDDVLYWIENEPEFGRQSVYLDGSYELGGWSPMDASTWRHGMKELKDMGVNFIAPPIWVLVAVEHGQIVPSLYAREAAAAGLAIITWTAERSGPLGDGGGWYHQTIKDVINNDGDIFTLLNVLHEDVGVVGLFSDWPATTTYYANCFGLK